MDRDLKNFQKYWIIHGELYDMEEFVRRHPGGEHTILLGKGRDCTELFESTHVMRNMDMVKAILSKYRVEADGNFKGNVAPCNFDWSSNLIHKEIISQVRNLFEGRTYKADTFYMLKMAAIITVWLLAYSYGMHHYNLILLFFAGIMWTSIGFTLMHDGSHSALSKKPFNNWLPMMLWNNMSLWNHIAWMIHHVWGHHSYTGIGQLDPDLNYNIVLKSDDQRIRGDKKLYRYQHYYIWAILLMIPNQLLSAALNYRFPEEIFGLQWLNLKGYQSRYVNAINIIYIIIAFGVPAYLHGFAASIACNVLYLTGAGATFFVIVLPNHDSIVVQSNLQYMREHHPNKLKDWAVAQIVSSGNFSNTNSIIDKVVTGLFGGMNYQIEHHLFPTVCHIHYPKISPIIRGVCNKYGIPYASRGGIFECIAEHYRLLEKFSKR
jgi:fatty acid desaturase